MLARRIYELKKARHLITGHFVDVNCATLRGDGVREPILLRQKLLLSRLRLAEKQKL